VLYVQLQWELGKELQVFITNAANPLLALLSLLQSSKVHS